MNKHLHPLFIAYLCTLFTYTPVNAQIHNSHISSSSSAETLSPSRLAFLSCYNSTKISKSTSVENSSNNYSSKPVDIAAGNVRMFSNKTEDELWVEVDTKKIHDNNTHLEIYNADGEVVYKTSVQQNLYKVNVCDFTAGTFLVKLGDKVQKMIIE